uniref:Ig-like domain-containing protein n=1 Tax=Sphenodon punctatus TaxID=8508 RepID=A0A8D0L702_SPHPU
MLGPVARSAVKTVRFYTLPQPKLVISPAETALHENVTLTCDSPGVQAPNLSLWIRNANRTLASGHERPLNFTLAAHEEDDGREFVCEVMTSAKGRTVRKTAFANLTVRYGPKMDTTTCPGNWTWEEGTEQTLSCTARGNPMPSVECVKDSVALKIGVSQRITRELTGTYRCTATNDRGSAVQDVSIRVQCE